MNSPMIHASAIAARFPQPSGRPRSTATVIRWMTKGVQSHGRLVKLKGTRVGHSWYCSEAHLREFIDELNGPAPPAVGVPVPVGVTPDLEAAVR